ncbi:hypothetical protein [Rhizobium sp. Root708]|uniref:hypothetical protein n=1 Tax=Rhizobium sp. Root708 TaxID=1736592 RepID=UPI000AFC62DC
MRSRVRSHSTWSTSVNSYIVTLFVFGFVVLMTTWLPLVVRHMPLSLPICCILIGFGLAWSPVDLIPQTNPLENVTLAET